MIYAVISSILLGHNLSSTNRVFIQVSCILALQCINIYTVPSSIILQVWSTQSINIWPISTPTSHLLPLTTASPIHWCTPQDFGLHPGQSTFAQIFFNHPNSLHQFNSTLVVFTMSWNKLPQQMVRMPWTVRGLQCPNPTPVGKQEGWHKPRRPPLYWRHEFEYLSDFFDSTSSNRVIFPEMVGDNHLQQSSMVKNGEVSMSPLTKGLVPS